jgi:hypothetical protein
MDDPGLARRVEHELRGQGLRRVLVDPTVLRQLASLLLGPDEEAERARRRDTAKRELAGMKLRWTRLGRALITQSDDLGAMRRAGGGEASPETAGAALPSA